MSNFELSNVDLEIATFYAPLILGSLKYGENRICVWFPGSGRTRIINDIFNSKKVLTNTLGGLYKTLTIIRVSEAEPLNFAELSKSCLEITSLGNEVLLVVNQTENLDHNDLKKLFINLSSLVSINQSRIHTIINLHSLDTFVNIADSNPAIYKLANKVMNLPLVEKGILDNYISEKSREYELNLNEADKNKISNYTGGILFLTKEILRNYNQDSIFNLKLRSVWSEINKKYQDIILKTINKDKVYLEEEKLAFLDLKNIGVIKLQVFKQNINLLNQDVDKILAKKLTTNESKIYKLLRSKKTKLVVKEDIAKILWGNDWEDNYSDWAVDKVMSRLRKKLATSGLDPEHLKTSKSKGYTWK